MLPLHHSDLAPGILSRGLTTPGTHYLAEVAYHLFPQADATSLVLRLFHGRCWDASTQS